MAIEYSSCSPKYFPVGWFYYGKYCFWGKNKSIADYYDEESIELVRQIYKKEIEEFNYQIPF